ncbi:MULTISPECIES: hypothetical protein [unclassified Rhizobium]|uniref:hypothetical protein n=1 Tax=unclassified Rhizobium TaxID=2613769 RepID=UPI00380EA016
MTPMQGLGKFSSAWSKIATELLSERPWDFTKKAGPSGPSRVIGDIEVGATFAALAVTAMEQSNGRIDRTEIWKDWAEAELEAHGLSLQGLKRLDKEKGLTVHSSTAKRIKKALDVALTALVHFGLFEKGPHNTYVLTASGRARLAELNKD